MTISPHCSRLFVWLFLFFPAHFGQTAFASDNTYTRLSMSGIDTVVVLVETVSSEMTRSGFTREAIISDVKDAFQEAGVDMQVWNKDLRIPGNPYLYININVFKSKEYVYSIGLEFRQDVFAVRDTDLKIDAVTWSRRYIGATSLVRDIRSHMISLVGIFINAYLSVNPRPETP